MDLNKLKTVIYLKIYHPTCTAWLQDAYVPFLKIHL